MFRNTTTLVYAKLISVLKYLCGDFIFTGGRFLPFLSIKCILMVVYVFTVSLFDFGNIMIISYLFSVF